MTPLERLARDVGTYDAEITVHLGPGAPSVSRGTLTGRLVAGDRWLVLDYLNPDSGFGGHGVYGWDAAQGCFVGTWVDNMTGSLRILRGHVDEPTGAVVYEGALDGPHGPMRTRETTTWDGPATRRFTSEVAVGDGPWMTVMSAAYKRR